MGKYTKVTIKGEMFKGDKLGIAVDAILADVGSSSASFMRGITRESDVSRRLSDSITWQTKDRGSNAYGEHKQEDKIEKPTEAGVVLVGSGAPHALYRDTYSGVHVTSDGSEEFIEELSKWASTVLGISKDSPDPYDQMRFWYLVEHIRNEKTFGIPFIDPTVAVVPKFVTSALKRAVKLSIGKV